MGKNIELVAVRYKFILIGAFLVAIQLGQIVHWYLPNESQATHHSANLKVLIANIIQSRTQPERQSNGMLALEVTQPNQINFLKTTMK